MIRSNIARSCTSVFARLVRDDSGAETVEAVLVVGLIAVVCIIAMKAFGISLALKWNDANDAM